MHIPENYLSPSTCAVMTAAMLPAWGVFDQQSKNGDTESENAASWYRCGVLISWNDV